MSYLMAYVADVHIGLLVIEGIRDEWGRYHVSIAQICELFGLDKTIGTREVKSLLGVDSRLDRVKVWGSRNRNYTNVKPT